MRAFFFGHLINENGLAILADLAMEAAMSEMTATDAKNRFGQLLEMAQSEPVHVQKDGRDVGIMISPGEYERLRAQQTSAGANPLIVKLHADSVKRWGKVYAALAK
jgi:hypothetical protein